MSSDFFCSFLELTSGVVTHILKEKHGACRGCINHDRGMKTYAKAGVFAVSWQFGYVASTCNELLRRWKRSIKYVIQPVCGILLIRWSEPAVEKGEVITKREEVKTSVH